ncbi:MAG: phospholipid carrier-dependent glycosyltransferase [Thermoguttaceae bacterium]|nr:phospholipid carrier-dependent glycosyltransferase [Thermoguttaceae bacterium]
MTQNSHARSLLGIFFLAFFLRGAVLFLDTRSFDRDPEHYRQAARTLRSEGALLRGKTPTASLPPLYPAMLAAVSCCSRPVTPERAGQSVPKQWINHLMLSPNASVALLHWILGVAAVVLVFQTALGLRLPEWIAWVCALLTAADPILLYRSRMVLPDTAIAFFTAAVIFSLVFARHRAGPGQWVLLFAAGLCCGLGAVLHWFFLPLMALIVLVLLVLPWLRSGERPVTHAAAFVFLAAAAIVLLPWELRNERLFGRPLLMTSRAGESLYLGNNPLYYDTYKLLIPFDEETFRRQWEERLQSEYDRLGITADTPQAEVVRNTLAARLAQETIRRRPNDFFWAAGSRMASLWRLAPQRIEQLPPETTDQIRTGVRLFYGVEFLLAALGLLKLLLKLCAGRPCPAGWLWPLAAVAAIVAIYLVFPAEIFDRGPIQPAIALIAGVFLVRERAPSSKEESAPNVLSEAKRQRPA